MPQSQYRVTRPLPWIDGGHPGPNLEWVGGKVVHYEAGETITVDDREVRDILDSLEALDDGGRLVLERTRSEMNRPARHTPVADLAETDRVWLVRATDESLRRQGQIAELMDRALARGEEPAIADVVLALRQDTPPSKLLIAYVVKVLTLPRRPGPKDSGRTTYEDLAIWAYYDYASNQARDAHAVDSRRSRAFSKVAKAATAKAFGISQRTVERVLALRPARPEADV